MDITEKELDELFERELTEDEYWDLVTLPKEDFTNHEELVLNYKKLVKHAVYCDRLVKEFRIRSTNKNMEIERLQQKLEEKCPEPEIEKLDEDKQFRLVEGRLFADYLCEGYTIHKDEGSIKAVKDGEIKPIVKIDGNEWRDNPPITVHKVTGKSLIVTVTDEYKDGRVEEVDKYIIVDGN